MEMTLRIAWGVFVLLAGIACVVWILWRLLKNSYDPAALVFRWVFTIVLIGGGFVFLNWLVGPDAGPGEKIAGVLAGAVFGLMFAVLWVPALMEKVSDIIGSLFTGGSEPAKPEPFYSVAIGRRKQGKFKEAIYEIQQQLERFPTDVTGQMMLADIQADDLKDIPAAQLTIERLCAQPGHSAPQIANAFNALADWHLKVQDVDAARAALEQIAIRLPDTDQAQYAAQRIAHLASKETLLAAHEHRPLELRAGIRDIGLLKDPMAVLRPELDPAEVAGQLVKHLEQHPADNEAREKLAAIYAEHYQRPDMALEQLEQLVAAPHQPGKEVARWLNVMADLQLRNGADYDTVRATLQRVIDLSPELAAAQLAQQRIELLRLELKGKEKSQVVKLGSYEKDIGLKGPRRN
jgi:tetratricopeptide (TPR) repeat protein